jgi:hypothetical protein
MKNLIVLVILTLVCVLFMDTNAQTSSFYDIATGRYYYTADGFSGLYAPWPVQVIGGTTPTSNLATVTGGGTKTLSSTTSQSVTTTATTGWTVVIQPLDDTTIVSTSDSFSETNSTILLPRQQYILRAAVASLPTVYFKLYNTKVTGIVSYTWGGF